MGKAFYMQKIKEENGIHYYEISDWQPDPTEFVVAINSHKKTISYFVNLDDVHPVTVIDFNLIDKVIPVPPWDKGLATVAFFLAGVQAYKAIQDNHFPDHLGKYS